MPSPNALLAGTNAAEFPSTAQPSVLVVDDSDTIRKFVTFALRARDLRVVTARDGLEALEKFAADPTDLVITDLNMPGLDGYGLVQAFRGESDTADLPIIVLSSLSSDEDVQRAIDLGADAYLVKPFDPKRIQYEVAKHLN